MATQTHAGIRKRVLYDTFTTHGSVTEKTLTLWKDGLTKGLERMMKNRGSDWRVQIDETNEEILITLSDVFPGGSKNEELVAL
jgi:hypothetical protein